MTSSVHQTEIIPMLHRVIVSLLPGLLLATLVAGVALLLERTEAAWFGAAWIEGLVLAILIGTGIRTVFRLPPGFQSGIHFASKIVLEIAIVLLGASISFEAIGNAGPMLFAAIAAVVVIALLVSYGIGRSLGLTHKLAILVACGNSICGNSAIAAVAPVIDADADDVAASIAFTAVLGIFAVLALPLVDIYFGMNQHAYGIFAGLTVYAVPQVLAATVPAGMLSVQVGTLVKLIRVLMLGPVILLIGAGTGRRSGRASSAAIVPWFILGFLAMMTLRSFGLVPDEAIAPMSHVSTTLTIVSMAALGLSVDVRTVAHAGGQVIAAASLSLLALAGISATVLALLS